MKSRILTGWNFVRWFWLAAGITISIVSVIEKNYLLLLPALYFILGAVLNVGCFAASCATGLNPGKKTSAKEGSNQYNSGV